MSNIKATLNSRRAKGYTGRYKYRRYTAKGSSRINPLEEGWEGILETIFGDTRAAKAVLRESENDPANLDGWSVRRLGDIEFLGDGKAARLAAVFGFHAKLAAPLVAEIEALEAENARLKLQVARYRELHGDLALKVS